MSQELREMLISLQNRIENLEIGIKELSNMELMYRPPHREEHVNIVQYLNEVEERLKNLEK
jgi:hypothetical protein